MRLPRLPGAPLTEALAVAILAAQALFWATGSLDQAVAEGALVAARVTGLMAPGAVPTWLTPLSCVFLHANLLHLGFNLLLLVYCGARVERVLGAGRTALMVLLGAYGAAAVQVALAPSSPGPVIGASGAISALIAAYALLHGPQRARRIGPFGPAPVRAAWLFAAWIALNLMQGFVFGSMGTALAVGAHIGGFLVGLIATPLLSRHIPRAPPTRGGSPPR